MKQVLIIVPGLGDDTGPLELATRDWGEKYGTETKVVAMPWGKNGESLKLKQERLLGIIDEYIKKKYVVSLLGTSAGGSAVINAFTARLGKIHRVISVCGRLYEGKNVTPELGWSARNNPDFKESVLQCEKNIEKLNENERKRILTIRPIFDETVPVSTMSIDGARNEQIKAAEHVLSMAVALTVYRKMIVDFIH